MNNKQKVLNFINKNKEGMSIRKIHQRTKISYPTAQRTVAILEAEKKVRIRNLGNTKLVSRRRR